MSLGSKPPRVTTKEAASILGTSIGVIYWYVHQGKLKSCAKPCSDRRRHHHLFARRDVELLLAQKTRISGRRTPISEAMLRATRAEAKCHELDLKVNGLLRLLGYSDDSIDMSEDGIRTAHRRAIALLDGEDIELEDALQLAYTTYHIDENFLRATERIVHDPEPWIVFMSAISKAMAQQHRTKDAYASAVHAYLCMAKRQLRDVAFEYVRMAHGFRAAESMVEHAPGHVDSIICSLLLHNIRRAQEQYCR